jgi:hypothetical protein
MMLAYKQLGKEIPVGNALIEQLPIEDDSVGQTARFDQILRAKRVQAAQGRRKPFH